VDRLASDFKLGIDALIKVDEDAESGGLKLQCIAIATFSSAICLLLQI